MTKTATPVSFICGIIKPYKYWYLLMLIAPIGSAIYPILYNYAIKLVIDLFTKYEHITYKQAFWPIFWFVIAQVILDGGWRLHSFALLKSMPYVFNKMTIRICKHVFYLPYTYFQNTLSGTIIGKVKGISDKYYNIHADLFYRLSKPALITLFSGIALALSNYKIFIFVFVFIILYSILALLFFKKLAKIEQDKQNSWYYLFGTIADKIQNITNILSFSSREKELGYTNKYYKDVQNPLHVKYLQYDLITQTILSLLYWILLIFVFLYVIHLKNIKEINVGDIVFIISMMFFFSENAWSSTLAIKDFLNNLAAFKSAFTIMQVPECTIDPPNATSLHVTSGAISFKDITFNYENSDNVFINLNLEIKPGEKIGIVGHSGAGKSTLVALLLKQFKAKSGNIQIDQQSIYDVSTDSLNENIALIPQDIMLFYRTIGENIGYAKEAASQREIEHAAKMANIHDFIVNQPEGYNTLVGERGIKLSGGQRQRIAIARAILKNAKILILDEATSSLDSHTEAQIQQSINTLLETNNASVIAVAHRLSTIKHMNRIIVLDNGKIVEDGSFSELLSISNGKFKSLWEHQVNGMIV